MMAIWRLQLVLLSWALPDVFGDWKDCSKQWEYLYASAIRVIVPYWIFLWVDPSLFQFIRPPRSTLSLRWDQTRFSSGLRGFLCHEQENHWPTLALFMGALEPFRAMNVWRQECKMHMLKWHLLVDYGHCRLGSFIWSCPFTKIFIHPDHLIDECRTGVTLSKYVCVIIVIILFYCYSPPPLLSSSSLLPTWFTFGFWFHWSHNPNVSQLNLTKSIQQMT